MIPDATTTGGIGERFREALRDELDRLTPHDRPAPSAALVVGRVVVVTTEPAAPAAAPRYAVHVARVEVVDGEAEVVAGVATPCVESGRRDVAERSADALAQDAESLRRRFGVGWNAVVVNDDRGNELYRRPIAAR